MTIAELIAQLSKMPQDMEVFISTDLPRDMGSDPLEPINIGEPSWAGDDEDGNTVEIGMDANNQPVEPDVADSGWVNIRKVLVIGIE